MNGLPTPSRRVFADLTATHLPDAAAGHSATPVQQAFVELTALLDTQAAALTEIDRIEARVVADLGYARIALPDPAGAAPIFAADADTIRRHVGDSPAARRLIARLRRRQHRVTQAAEAAGLHTAQARERALTTEISVTTAALLLAPVRIPADVALKLIVLIAMSEPGPPEATVFPGAYLRVLLADLDRTAVRSSGRA